MSECLCKVKKGLEFCSQITGCREECPYHENCNGMQELTSDALQVITEQETLLDEKQKHLENLQKVNEDLEERIAIMSESGLFPVSKKKPPYDKDVLLYLKSGEYFVGHRENHWGQDVYCDGELGGGYVYPTHWMYLPKKLKEGDQDD